MKLLTPKGYQKYLKKYNLKTLTQREKELIRKHVNVSQCNENDKSIIFQCLEGKKYEKTFMIMFPLLIPTGDFENFVFPTLVDFRNSKFTQKTSFKDAKFTNEADFAVSQFAYWVKFENSEFAMHADFKEANFKNSALFQKSIFMDFFDFEQTKFGSEANFCDCFFNRKADFTKAIFRGGICCKHSVFNAMANFSATSFIGGGDFAYTIFKRYTNFNKAKFSYDVNFSDTYFMAEATDFSETTFERETIFVRSTFKGLANFNHAQLKTKVDFTNCNFITEPPTLYDANITEDVTWDCKNWPNPYSINARSHINAYERLALMMSKLEKYHDHHMFYRLEMRARKVAADNPLVKLAYGVYESLCDYGYGFERALVWWVAQMGFMAGWIYLHHEGSGWPSTVNSLVISIANSHGFLGLHRGPLKELYALYTGDPGFNAIWAFQSVIGVVLLFFLLLSLRNRFRMK